MSTVDNRVVEMTFDNSAFERNLATTMASLDKLKGNLDFSGAQNSMRDLSSVAKNFDTSSMASAIENISSKFSVMGAVGFTVIQDLTRAVTNFVSNTANKILDPIMGGGMSRALNLEQARFLFRGLEMDIDSSMDSALKAVEGTAYGLDVAAKAAAQLGGSGLKAGDEMTAALRGIAGIAAMTNSSYEEMADIFITAAGNGKVMSNELGRISHRGVNAAAALAKVWGITEAEVRAMATEGEISFQMFAAAMNDAFGEHATKANETYTGSLANMRAALARLGASFIGPHLERMRDLFNAARPVIDSFHKALKPVINAFHDIMDITFTNVINFLDNLDFADVTAAMQYFATAMRNTFKSIKRLIAPVSEAFRTIFPKKEASYPILAFARTLEKFTNSLILGGETSEKVKRIFAGVFAVLEIGWTIVKEVAGAFKELFGHFADSAGLSKGGVLDFLANLGDKLVNLNEKLVEGGGIADFFDKLVNGIKDPLPHLIELKNKLEEVFNILFKGDFTGVSNLQEDSGIVDFLFNIREAIEDVINAIKDPLPHLENLKDSIADLFGGKGLPDGLAKPFERINSRFENLSETAKKVATPPDWLAGFFDGVKETLSTVFSYIKEWFVELGDKLAAAMGPGDYDAVLDALNISLLGGIALLLKKFLDGGFKFDFSNGMIDNINESLGALTGKLTAMQTEIKANALLKIAGAIALLTASVLVLSMIDSAALTKALTAMTVGFGQLVGSMQLISQMGMGAKGATSMSIIAAGMIMLSGAVLILSFAAKNLAGLDWEDLGKGLLGVSVLLNLIAQTAQAMQGNVAGLIRAGIGISFIAVALNILAVAMKIFATMSWEDMGKGLLGVAGGLSAIIAAVNLMPDGMVAKGAGILMIGVALNLLATSMKIFATMSWEDMAKGLYGVGVGLGAIALGMKYMPGGKKMLANAAALLVVSISLNAIATAMKIMGSMSWEEVAIGLAAMAGSLIILAAASWAMSGSIAGALAIGIMAFSLGSLYEVIKEFSKLSMNELAMGLLGMAAALAVLGGAAFILTPLVGSMLALGAAMLLIGAGFALIGLGANAVARAFGIIAKAGKAGIETVLFFVDSLIERVPAIIGAFAMGLVELAQTFLDAAPVLLKALGVLIQHILETIEKLAPEFASTGIALLQEFFRVLQEVVPDFVETGIVILLAFLQGVRDNIGEVTTLVGEIITEFLVAFEAQIPPTVSAFASMLITLFEEVANAVGLVAGTLLLGIGASFLAGFWEGISGKVSEIYGNIKGFIEDVINWFKSGFGIFSPSKVMAVLGGDLMLGLLKGIVDGAVAVTKWFRDLAKNTLSWIGTLTRTLFDKGWDLLQGLLTGVTDFARLVLKTYFITLPNLVFGWIGDVAEKLKNKGHDLIVGLYNGVIGFVNEKLSPWFRGLKDKVLSWISDTASWLYTVGWNIIVGFKNGINDKWNELVGWVSGKLHALKNLINVSFLLSSPSRWAMGVGGYIVEGLAIGIRKNMHAEEAVNTMTSNMQKALEKGIEQLKSATNEIGDSIEIRITPVLDLTNMQRDAKQLGMMGGLSPKITTDLSYAQASTIASTDMSQNDISGTQDNTPREVKFEQNNYSPTQLSVADIYRQTRNQITVAKEELNIP